MSAEENKTLLKNMFAEFAKGNGDALVDAMHDDIEWTLTGTTSISNVYKGKKSVLEDFLGPVTAAVDGHMHITPENFIADGDYIALQGHGEARMKNGAEYNNTYCWVYKFKDGKIISVVEYLDTELVTKAFG
ncbi:MAG: ketosteroid isomerase-like protein [Gammaproteobacteria bacterium]|jgi:ketosteroid isomerase-like protein